MDVKKTAVLSCLLFIVSSLAFSVVLETRLVAEGITEEAILVRIKDGYRVAYVQEGRLRMKSSDDTLTSFNTVDLPNSVLELTEVHALKIYATPGAAKGLTFLARRLGGAISLFSLAVDVPNHQLELVRLDEDGVDADVSDYTIEPSGHYFVREFYWKNGKLFTVLFDPYWAIAPRRSTISEFGNAVNLLCWESEGGTLGASIVIQSDGTRSLVAFDVAAEGLISVDTLISGIPEHARVSRTSSSDGRTILLFDDGSTLAHYERVASRWILRSSQEIVSATARTMRGLFVGSKFIVLLETMDEGIDVLSASAYETSFSDRLHIAGSGELLTDIRSIGLQPYGIMICTLRDNVFRLYSPGSPILEPASLSLSGTSPFRIIPIRGSKDIEWLAVSTNEICKVQYSNGVLSTEHIDFGSSDSSELAVSLLSNTVLQAEECKALDCLIVSFNSGMLIFDQQSTIHQYVPGRFLDQYQTKSDSIVAVVFKDDCLFVTMITKE